MSNDTFVVVFPSLFAENNISLLVANIKKILKAQNQNFDKISRDGNLILVDANDPVFASTAINLLFGIKQVVIAKQIKNNFKTVVDEITRIGSSLLLKGEKFYVNVSGNPKGYVAKDVELAATSSLIESNKKINARPGTDERHDKLLFTHITKSTAYVSLFSDNGLGGAVNNSQDQKAICGIFDEFSALACLETIKQGFEVKIAVFYQKHKEIIDLLKILQKILPRTLQTKPEIEFYNTPAFGSNLVTKNSLLAKILSKIATKEKISHVVLPVSPLLFRADFIKKLQISIFENGLVPYIPLSGIDSEIFDNAKEIGLEKFVLRVENVLRRKETYQKKKFTDTAVNAILKRKKTIPVKLGPNMLHEVLDTLQVKH